VNAPVPAVKQSVQRLSIAPMMDWTDTWCRVFHRVLSAHARLYTEMVHANAVIHGPRAQLLAMDPVEHPVALQLGGSDPALLAEAARIGVAHGFDEINLNCGCPSDRVQAGRFGACLMREPVLVARCVEAMIAAVGGQIPVTIKCRLGVDDEDDFARFLGFIDTVASAGCQHFIVHARNAWLKGLSPKENRDIPPLRHDWVWRLKRERSALAVTINGGLASVDAVHTQLAHVDGAMLGRAAYHTPYLLHQLDTALFGGAAESRSQLLRALRPHVEAQLALGVRLQQMTRHMLGLFHGQPGGRAFRRALSEGACRPDAGWALLEQALSLVY